MEKTISLGKYDIELYFGRSKLTNISLSIHAAYNRKGELIGSFFVYLLWPYIGFEVWRLDRTTGTD